MRHAEKIAETIDNLITERIQHPDKRLSANELKGHLVDLLTDQDTRRVYSIGRVFTFKSFEAHLIEAGESDVAQIMVAIEKSRPGELRHWGTDLEVIRLAD